MTNNNNEQVSTNQILAANLNAIMIRWGVSAKEFAEVLQSTPQKVSQYTAGEFLPKPPFLFRVSDATGISLDYLLRTNLQMDMIPPAPITDKVMEPGGNYERQIGRELRELLDRLEACIEKLEGK